MQELRRLYLDKVLKGRTEGLAKLKLRVEDPPRRCTRGAGGGGGGHTSRYIPCGAPVVMPASQLFVLLGTDVMGRRIDRAEGVKRTSALQAGARWAASSLRGPLPLPLPL